MGSGTLNLRLVVGAFLLMATLWIVKGAPWPLGHELQMPSSLFPDSSASYSATTNFRSMVILGPESRAAHLDGADLHRSARLAVPARSAGTVSAPRLGAHAWRRRVIRNEGSTSRRLRSSTWMGVIAGIFLPLGLLLRALAFAAVKKTASLFSGP
jgi:hypothetical protein